MKRKGFTLLEVVLSIGLSAIIATMIFPAIGWLTKRSSRLKYDGQASRLLQEAMESTYNIYLADWDGEWHRFEPDTPYYTAVRAGNPGGWTMWDINPGKLEAKFDRQIKLFRVCRDTNGEWEKTGNNSCKSGKLIDTNSRLIESEVSWEENGNIKRISCSLLMTKLN